MQMDILKLSECCGVPFPEPGYPDTDLCGLCNEHTGYIEREDTMNTELDKLQVERFLYKNLLDLRDAAQAMLTMITVQMECNVRRIKSIQQEIGKFEDTMQDKELIFSNLTPIKEEKHGTRIT